MPNEHWLTEKQVEVLKLREGGASQSEISEKMGTTRSNISAIERNARRNIEKSKATLELAKVLRAPVTLDIEKGVSLYTIPKLVFEKGDDTGIDIDLSGPELLRKIRDNTDSAISGKEVVRKLTIGISRDGEVNISAEESKP